MRRGKRAEYVTATGNRRQGLEPLALSPSQPLRAVQRFMRLFTRLLKHHFRFTHYLALFSFWTQPIFERPLQRCAEAAKSNARKHVFDQGIQVHLTVRGGLFEDVMGVVR
jgi:hypothetical protein